MFVVLKKFPRFSAMITTRKTIVNAWWLRKVKDKYILYYNDEGFFFRVFSTDENKMNVWSFEGTFKRNITSLWGLHDSELSNNSCLNPSHIFIWRHSGGSSETKKPVKDVECVLLSIFHIPHLLLQKYQKWLFWGGKDADSLNAIRHR